ncbi:MAG: nucleoside-diphosphate sugar epimerase/dehydratase [Clostridia bacterium]
MTNYEKQTTIKKVLYTAFAVLFDVIAIIFSMCIAFFLKYDAFLLASLSDYTFLIYFFVIISFVVLISNLIFDCYSGFLKAAGVIDAIKLAGSGIVALTTVLIIANVPPLGKYNITTSFILLTLGCTYGLATISRFSYRLLKNLQLIIDNLINYKTKSKVVLVGGLTACKASADLLLRDVSKNRLISAMFVTTKDAISTKVNGIHAEYSSTSKICTYIKEKDISEIIVCTDKLSKEDIMTIFSTCKNYNCSMLKYSHLESFSQDTLKPNFSNFNIEDILGRDSRILESDQLREFIKGKVILVTGGAGSIGSELCRQVLDLGCAKLIALDINENGLFYLNEELLTMHPKGKFDIVLASIRDYIRMEKTFIKYRPDIVLHAAAHKHVPLMESNAGEAIKNNVFGTRNVAELAAKYNVNKFLLISSDKAVNPTNVMGATKRIAELIILEENEKSPSTDFVAVRFGNVLGSNGSVVHTFKSRIEAGGPVYVTHPDMERFFMTIKEAVSLVLTAGSMAKGGEIFVLDMGTPIKIKDLAEDMIRLSGLRPGIDIKIEYSGLRPGEKMFEELNLDDEKTDKTDIDKIRILNIKSHCPDLDKKLLDLNALTISPAKVNYRHAIKGIVAEYVEPPEEKPKVSPLTSFN